MVKSVAAVESECAHEFEDCLFFVLASIIKSISGRHGGRVVGRGLCFRHWRLVMADGVGSL